MNSYWQGVIMSLRGGNQINPPYISPFLHQLMIAPLSLDEHTLSLSWHDLWLSNPNASRALGKSGRAFEPKTTHLGQGYFSHQEETEALGTLSVDDPRLEEPSPFARVKNVKALSSDGQQTKMQQHADASLTHFSVEQSNEKTGAHSENLAQIRADFERSALAAKRKVNGAYQGVGEYVHNKAHFQLPPNFQSSPKCQLNQETYAWARQTQGMQAQPKSAYSTQAASRIQRGIKSDIYNALDSQIDSDFYADLDSGPNSEIQADLNKLSMLKKLESKIIKRLNQGSLLSEGIDEKLGGQAFGLVQKGLLQHSALKDGSLQDSALKESALQKTFSQNLADNITQRSESGSLSMHRALMSPSANKVFNLLYQNLSDFLIKKMCHQGTEVQRRQIDDSGLKLMLNNVIQQVQSGLIKRLALDARWAAWPQQTQANRNADPQKIPDETVTAYLVSSLKDNLASLTIESRHPQNVHGKSLHQYLTQAFFQQADLSQLTEGIRQHLLMDNQGERFRADDDRHFQHRGEAPAWLSLSDVDFFSEGFIKAREEYGARLSTLFANMRMNKSKVAMALSKVRTLSLLSDFVQGIARGGQGLNRPLTGRLNDLAPWGSWLSSLSGVGSLRPSSIFPECADPMLLNFETMERRFASRLDKHHSTMNNIESYLSPLAFIENRDNLPSKQALGLKTELNPVTSGLLLKGIQAALTPLDKSGPWPSQYSQLQSNVTSSLLFDAQGWMQNGKVSGDELKHLERGFFALNQGLASSNGIDNEVVRQWLIRRLHRLAVPDSSVLPHWHNIHNVNFNMGEKRFGLEREVPIAPILGDQSDGNVDEDHFSASGGSFSNSFLSSDTSLSLVANADSPLSTSGKRVNGYCHKSHIQTEYHHLIKNHTRVPLPGNDSREKADLRFYEQAVDTEIKLAKDEKLSLTHDVSQTQSGEGRSATFDNKETALTRMGQAGNTQASTTDLNRVQLDDLLLNNTHLNRVQPHDLPLSNTHINRVQSHDLPLSNTQLNIPFNTESRVSPSVITIKSLPTGKDKSLGTAEPLPVRLNVGRITYNRPAFSAVKSPVKKRPRPTMTLSDYNQRLRGE